VTGVHPPMLLLEQVSTLNAAVNYAVRYVDDEQLTGRSDDWATADETLRRGAGDCEDIAILKMQLLAALGIPERELYLSIVRDLVRAKDHAVLVVYLQGRSWLLDSNTDRVLDAGDANSYVPVITLSGDYKWLHGGPLPQLSALSSPRSGP
jgi:predicted transglutaminase-like cysteine proteinase